MNSQNATMNHAKSQRSNAYDQLLKVTNATIASSSTVVRTFASQFLVYDDGDDDDADTNYAG